MYPVVVLTVICPLIAFSAVVPIVSAIVSVADLTPPISLGDETFKLIVLSAAILPPPLKPVPA